MITSFIPLYDRILVKRTEPETKTESGIIMPGADNSGMGTVIKVGAGRLMTSGRLRPLTVRKGDVIYFNKFAGVEVEKDYILLREDEVMGIISRAKKDKETETETSEQCVYCSDAKCIEPETVFVEINKPSEEVDLS